MPLRDAVAGSGSCFACRVGVGRGAHPYTAGEEEKPPGLPIWVAWAGTAPVPLNSPVKPLCLQENLCLLAHPHLFAQTATFTLTVGGTGVSSRRRQAPTDRREPRRPDREVPCFQKSLATCALLSPSSSHHLRFVYPRNQTPQPVLRSFFQLQCITIPLSLRRQHLELQGLALLLLVTTQLEVLTSLQRQLSLGLAADTLQSQHNLLGGLGLLVEDRLGLTTVTGLLTVVSSLTLGKERSLTGLVLGDLVLCVLSALLTLAESFSKLRNVDWGLVFERWWNLLGQRGECVFSYSLVIVASGRIQHCDAPLLPMQLFCPSG